MSDEIHKKLSEHPLNKKRIEEGKSPANVVLLRGCGFKIKAEPFNEKYKTKAASVCPTAIIAGVVLTLNIDRVQPEGVTGDYHTNLLVKSQVAFKSLYQDGYEFFFLHVKPYDEAGHDGLLHERGKLVERIDEMVGHFMSLVKDQEEDCVVAITGDHSTPLYFEDHTTEPVPCTISCKKAFHNHSQFFMKDQCTKFDEVEVAKGKLGRFAGHSLMPLIFKIKDRINEKGCS